VLIKVAGPADLSAVGPPDFLSVIPAALSVVGTADLSAVRPAVGSAD
jgi:hypothetical protein